MTLYLSIKIWGTSTTFFFVLFILVHMCVHINMYIYLGVWILYKFIRITHTILYTSIIELNIFYNTSLVIYLFPLPDSKHNKVRRCLILISMMRIQDMLIKYLLSILRSSNNNSIVGVFQFLFCHSNYDWVSEKKISDKYKRTRITGWMSQGWLNTK